ncbi:hypothetical protein N7517_009605 [Penicillium concentricum]|uniref:Uncharacterized protein n=1 Tax=Penicillium concentricum TaxID=293559 RepID=A0A9W9UXL5_9EURO|nr:uncharacterized protein N7517_009605 [Penicillium concentricum]KAJ5360414.1 hypothetical protein N7517_009605 [Penicillium concentricum]
MVIIAADQRPANSSHEGFHDKITYGVNVILIQGLGDSEPSNHAAYDVATTKISFTKWINQLTPMLSQTYPWMLEDNGQRIVIMDMKKSEAMFFDGAIALKSHCKRNQTISRNSLVAK